MWIIASLISLGIIFWFLGWRWESKLQRPKLSNLKNMPLVSILIPAYKSSSTIEATLKSVANLNYPKKELIVANDFNDNISALCKKYGARLVQNNKRIGKALALNKAVKLTSGKILFFLDSDTVVTKNCLLDIIPWFSSPDIAVVAPKYITKNKNNLLTRFISIENRFLTSLFKIHMFFGSMIAFRGCGVAIRRNVFEKLGGWPNTLIEDTDLAAKIIKAGWKIQYEPQAIIKTQEPDTISKLYKQRFRWGKGGIYAFLHHKRAYSKNTQFFTHIYVYLLFALAIIGFVLWKSVIYIIPLLFLYLISVFSIKEVLIFSALFLVPLFSSLFTSITTACISHVAIVTCTEQTKFGDVFLIIPYIFFYIPLIMFGFLRGIISGWRDHKKKRPEIDFSTW